MLRITNKLSGITLCLLAVTSVASGQTNLTAKAGTATPSQPVSAAAETDRTRDGLVGPVRRLRTTSRATRSRISTSLSLVRPLREKKFTSTTKREISAR